VKFRPVRDNMFGIDGLPKHCVHSVPVQNHKRGRFSPESVVTKTHLVAVVIGAGALAVNLASLAIPIVSTLRCRSLSGLFYDADIRVSP
jgi:hypothetical protein